MGITVEPQTRLVLGLEESRRKSRKAALLVSGVFYAIAFGTAVVLFILGKSEPGRIALVVSGLCAICPSIVHFAWVLKELRKPRAAIKLEGEGQLARRFSIDVSDDKQIERLIDIESRGHERKASAGRG